MAARKRKTKKKTTPRASAARTKKPSRKTTKKKPGRPSKRTPEMMGMLEGCLRVGDSLRIAALRVGISESTLRKWRSEDAEFSARLEKAASEPIHGVTAKAYQAIMTATPSELLRSPALLIFWMKTRIPEFRESFEPAEDARMKEYQIIVERVKKAGLVA